MGCRWLIHVCDVWQVFEFMFINLKKIVFILYTNLMRVFFWLRGKTDIKSSDLAQAVNLNLHGRPGTRLR